MLLVTDGTADRACRGVDKISDEDKELLKQYAKYNMNKSRTARHIYAHLNTVRYQLERIKKKTGLDPMYFYDLVALLVAIEEEGKKEKVDTDVD